MITAKDLEEFLKELPDTNFLNDDSRFLIRDNDRLLSYRKSLLGDISPVDASGTPPLKVVRLGDSDPVNNSTVLVDDPEIKLLLEPNSITSFFLLLQYRARATGDFKGGFSIPSGASLYWNMIDDAGNISYDETTSRNLTGNNTFDIRQAIFWGTVVNGVNVGNLQFQYAQQASIVEDVWVREGTTLLGWNP